MRPKTRPLVKHPAVNDLDRYILDFRIYKRRFEKIFKKTLKYEEWVQALMYINAETYKERTIRVRVNIEDLRAIADLFEEEHPYLTPIIIPTLHHASWARHIGLISEAELDAINTLWRKTC